MWYSPHKMDNMPTENESRLFYKRRKHLSKKISDHLIGIDIGSHFSGRVRDTMELRTIPIKRRSPITKREGMCQKGVCELFVGGIRISDSFSGECWLCELDLE